MKTISIDDHVYEQIQKKVSASDEFSSVDEYIKYVLDELLKDDKQDNDTPDSSYSKEDEEKVKDKLRSLGYLD